MKAHTIFVQTLFVVFVLCQFSVCSARYNLNNPRKLVELIGDKLLLELQEKQEDFDDSCPLTIERGEWLQFYTWLTNYMGPDWQSKVTNDPNLRVPGSYDGLTHEVTDTVIYIDDRTELQRLVITEQKNRIPTRGGSKFRIRVSSKIHVQVCPIKDYFNGTYLACCTIDKTFIHENYEIGIRLKFSNFKAFSRINIVSDQSVWEKNYPVIRNFTQMSMYRLCDPSTVIDHDSGYWLRLIQNFGDYNQFVIPDNTAKGGHCIFNNIATSKLEKCFKQKYHHKVTLMGDSHMRYAFIRLSISKEDMDVKYQKGHRDDVALNSHYFRWKPFCSDLVEALENYLIYREEFSLRNTFTSPVNHLLVLGVGQWDMAARSAQVFMSCLANDLLPVLRRVQELPDTVIIWQDMTPMPTIKPRKDHRNNFSMGAMNYVASVILNPILRVPALSIALPWSEHLTCIKTHLMMIHKVDCNPVCKGFLQVVTPGRVINDLIGFYACKEYI